MSKLHIRTSPAPVDRQVVVSGGASLNHHDTVLCQTWPRISERSRL